MLVKSNIKYKTFYFSYTYYIENLLSIYNIIKTNSVSTLIVKKSTILLSKNKNAKFDIINY